MLQLQSQPNHRRINIHIFSIIKYVPIVNFFQNQFEIEVIAVAKISDPNSYFMTHRPPSASTKVLVVFPHIVAAATILF